MGSSTFDGRLQSCYFLNRYFLFNFIMEAVRFTNKSILIVEDDDSIRNTLKLVLEFAGYEVQMCGNGQEALDLLKRQPTPALIILDLMMPVMNGWTFSEELQKNAVWAAVPIVIISAFEEKVKTFERASAVI